MSSSTEATPRKLKILMLHGYTQSASLFHAKTRALEKALNKAFPALPPPPHNRKPLPGTLPSYPGGIQLIYPTGPMRLRPSDIPGYDSSSPNGVAEDEEIDSWGWFRRDTGSGEYTGLEEGLNVIATAIKENGGVDGVIGFSQGACAAAFTASLLEKERIKAFEAVEGGFAYPNSFRELLENEAQGPLKFAVSYCGFYAPNSLYSAFYEPKIETPTMHFIGSLDSVVEESRTLALVEKTVGGEGRKVYHPGGHFVPIGKEMVGVLIGFIRETCGKDEASKEESVEDMDVPF